MPRAPVYSVSFILYTEAAENNYYEVPAGYIAVIRQIAIGVLDAGGFFALNIQDSDEAPTVGVYYVELAAAATSVLEEVRFVVPAGGIISLYQQTLGLAATAYVGGYLLGIT